MQGKDSPVDVEGNQEQVDQKAESQIAAQSTYYLDPQGGYDNPTQGKLSEAVAMLGMNTINRQSLPDRDFLNQTITPTLQQALTEVSIRRPSNPLEFVAYYLLSKAPQDHQETVSEQQQLAQLRELASITMTQQTLNQ